MVHGRKLGRTIGYPTANIALDPETGLKQGIYAVRMIVDGVSRPGVASFGTRPTFDNGPPLFETFLFDFSGDLYGRFVEIELHAWLRPEMKFDGIDPLLGRWTRTAGRRGRCSADSALSGCLRLDEGRMLLDQRTAQRLLDQRDRLAQPVV